MTTKAYYKRDGSVTDIQSWTALQRDVRTIQVDNTRLENGRWVSTIWLGIADQADAKPMIFETSVFNDETRRRIEKMRHANEAGALQNHALMVRKWG